MPRFDRRDTGGNITFFQYCENVAAANRRAIGDFYFAQDAGGRGGNFEYYLVDLQVKASKSKRLAGNNKKSR